MGRTESGNESGREEWRGGAARERARLRAGGARRVVVVVVVGWQGAILDGTSLDRAVMTGTVLRDAASASPA